MSRGARVVLVVATGVTLVLLLGQLLIPGRSPWPSASPDVGSSPPPAGPVVGSAPAAAGRGLPSRATTIVAGVPMGYSHDAAGAKAAAAGFAQAYGTLVALDDAAAEAARRAMVSAGVADELVADMRADLASLRRTWPVGAITYQVAPLAVRVRMDGPDAADTGVWYVGVVSGSRIAPYEDWVTQSYRLVWERGDWRMAAEADAPGPRPDPGGLVAATPAELASRLAGFEAVS